MGGNLNSGRSYHITTVFFANFQNNLLPSGEKSLVAKSLVIESVDRHEAGIYICEAKNGVGHKSATASIKLQVLCKFSMPFSASLVESVQEFFYQVGHQTTNASIRNNYVFTK